MMMMDDHQNRGLTCLAGVARQTDPAVPHVLPTVHLHIKGNQQIACLFSVNDEQLQTRYPYGR